MGYRDHLPAAAPSWLRDTDAGQAWLEEHGQALDDLVAEVKSAVKARMPTEAPADALPWIGQERQILRAPFDANESYAKRLEGAWDTWPFAGSAVGILLALYAQGYGSGAEEPPIIVQQNGLAHQLALRNQFVPTGTTAIDFGHETLVLFETPLGPNPAIGGNMPLAAGVTEWWSFSATDLDGNNDQWNNRFGLIFPEPMASWTDIQDPPTPTSAPSLDEVNTIRQLVHQWRAGESLFMWITVIGTGAHYWGEPGLTWGEPGLTWGSGSSGAQWGPDLE